MPLLKALNAFKKPFTPTDQMTLVQFYSLCEGRGQAEVTVGDNPQQLVSGTAFISSQSSLFGGKGGIKPLLSYGENYSSVIPFFLYIDMLERQKPQLTQKKIVYLSFGSSKGLWTLQVLITDEVFLFSVISKEAEKRAKSKPVRARGSFKTLVSLVLQSRVLDCCCDDGDVK